MMPTVFTHDDPGIAVVLQQALETSQTLIFPTDTVYGIGGNPWDARTLDRVRELKQRAADQPFTLHLPTVASIARYARVDAQIERWIDALLPGPYTLLLPVSGGAPASAVSGPTVGIRVPAHPFFAGPVAHLDRPLFGTSVNVHGQPPLSDIAEIIDRFSRVDVIISGPVGLGPSAILDLASAPPRILRGEVGEDVERLLGLRSED